MGKTAKLCLQNDSIGPRTKAVENYVYVSPFVLKQVLRIGLAKAFAKSNSQFAFLPCRFISVKR